LRLENEVWESLKVFLLHQGYGENGKVEKPARIPLSGKLCMWAEMLKVYDMKELLLFQRFQFS